MRNPVFNNLGLKISAVVLSIFLWLFVTSRGKSEISLDIPLEFKNIPVGLGIVTASDKSVIITIRGQERLMKNVKSSDIRVFVDLGKAKKGEGTYFINKDDIKLPYAMSAENVTPSSVKVRLDETISKPVPVRPVMTGVPEKGFYVKAVEVDPRNVIIQGLKTEVRKVNELRTEALDITGLNETISEDLKIEAAGVNIKPEVASVKVTVIMAGKKK